MSTVASGRLRTRVRPLQRDEEATLAEVFAGLSPTSRYHRYHSPMPRLPAAMVRRLLDVDGRRHVALVVELRLSGRWTPVGIGRSVRGPDGVTDVAVEVVDQWQGRGLGRLLATALVRRGDHHLVSAYVATIAGSNAAGLRLARAVWPDAVTHVEDGTVHVMAPSGTGRTSPVACGHLGCPGVDDWRWSGWMRPSWWARSVASRRGRRHGARSSASTSARSR